MCRACQERRPDRRPLAGRGSGHGGGTYSAYSHTYKIETDTKIFELDCGKTAMFHSTGEGCGGNKKLEIGDVIHFRIKQGLF